METVTHVFLVKQFQCIKQFRTCQAELRSIAAALFPFSASTGCQLNANADIRTDIQLLGFTGNQLKLIHLLHDDEDLLAHLLRQEGELDKVFVLVAVTDNHAVALALHGNDSMEFGL